MKWVLAPLLWLIAVTLALLVLYRLWRGQPVVLRGRWAPPIIRIVAIVLVVLGVGAENGPAAPITTGTAEKETRQESDQLPPSVTAPALAQWLVLQQPASPWTKFKLEFTRLGQGPAPADAAALKAVQARLSGLPVPLRRLVQADLMARESGKAIPHVAPAQLIATLDQLERSGYYDHWLNAYLWRKSASTGAGEGQQLVELYTRLEQHARIVNALLAARARIKPMLQPPRAWMSKAGPSRFGAPGLAGPEQAGAELLGAIKVLYPISDDGTWRRDALVVVGLPRGSAPVTLVRAGHSFEWKPGQRFRIHRLDLLTTPAGDNTVVLELAWFGRLTLPAGRVLSVWDLPQYLSKEARAKLDSAIKDALNGDDKAAGQLEQALPLAHSLLREALARSPQASGAPRLRMILSLFDDAVP